MGKTATIKETCFSLSKLRTSCRKLFNVSATLFEAATFDLDKDKKYTVTDVKQIIKKWSQGKVK